MGYWRTGINAASANGRWRVGVGKPQEKGKPAFLDKLRRQMTKMGKERGTTPAVGTYANPRQRGWPAGTRIPKSTVGDVIDIRNGWVIAWVGNMLGRIGFFDDELRARINREIEAFGTSMAFLVGLERGTAIKKDPIRLAAMYPFNERFWSALRRMALFMDSVVHVKTPEKRIVESIKESIQELPSNIGSVLPKFPWKYFVYGAIGLAGMWGFSSWQDARLRSEIKAGRMDRARRGLL